MVIADTETDNEDAIAFFKAMEFALSARHARLGKTLRRPVKSNPKPADASPNTEQNSWQ